MRLHVVGLPHTTNDRDAYSWCAYTSKMIRFVDMMESQGFEVNAYWGEGMDGHIPPFDYTHPLWVAMQNRVLAGLKETAEPGDYLCLAAGLAQKPIADARPDLIPVEYGVGYGGVWTDFCVFESYAWMHTVYGANAVIRGGNAHDSDGRFYDAVIPNAYHKREFPAGDGRGDYLLFIGRNIPRKGVEIARLTAQYTGVELITVGPGFDRTVQPKERATLMGGARAVMVPTTYVEPFGGVHAEALMCGTPVITTDWGVFTETVENGVNGFRCRTLKEFVEAAEAAPDLNRKAIRRRAFATFSTDVVSEQYADYFNALETVRTGKGWYALD